MSYIKGDDLAVIAADLANKMPFRLMGIAATKRHEGFYVYAYYESVVATLANREWQDHHRCAAVNDGSLGWVTVTFPHLE